MRILVFFLLFSLAGFTPADGWAQSRSKSGASRTKKSRKAKKQRRPRRVRKAKKPQLKRGYLLAYGGGGGLFTSSPGQQKVGVLDLGVGAGLPWVGLILGGSGAFFDDPTRSEGQVYFDVKILGRDTGYAEPFFQVGAAIVWNRFEDTSYTGGGLRAGVGLDLRANPHQKTDVDLGLSLKAVYTISPSPFPDSYAVQNQFMILADLLIMYRGQVSLM